MKLSRPLALAAVLGIGATALAVAGAGNHPTSARPSATPSAKSSISSTPSPAARPRAGVNTARPNVVMITTDDAAVSDLRWMPHTRALMEQKGVTLTDAIAPTPICVPARASLLTGQYADNHGAVTISGPRGGYEAFRDSDTLPVWLQRAGYTTMFTGKYLNGYSHPRHRADVPPGWTDWRGATRGTYDYFNTDFNVNGRQVHSQGYSTDVITNDSVTQLALAHRTPHKPFFQWVNYVGPHAGGPVENDDPRRRWPQDPSVWVGTAAPAPQDVNKFNGVPIPKLPGLWEKDVRGNHLAGPPRSADYKLAVQEAFEQRIESLQSVDRGVARIVHILKRQGVLDNTYVIFASDNGFLTGQHNKLGKLVPYDMSLRIPMIIRGPGVPQGKKLSTTVTNPDIAVSIASVAGAHPTRDVDGVPVFQRLSQPPATRPVPISGWVVHNGDRQLYRGIRTKQYTYFKAFGHYELYDRSRDRGELDNVVNRPAYAKARVEMQRLYDLYATCKGDTCPKSWN